MDTRSEFFIVPLVAFLAALTTIPAQAAGDPVAHWTFDEAGGAIAYDSVGDNDGLIHGAQWTAGKLDDALSFDGVDDYVEVADAPSLRFSQNDSFSIAFWTKPSSERGWMLSKARTAGRRGVFGFYMAGGPPEFQFFVEKSYAGWVVISAPCGTPGSWQHVVAVYANKDMKIYLDAELEGSGHFSYDTGDTEPDKHFVIGARSYDDTIQFYNGEIDDVRIYDRALSALEIEQLYGQTQDGPVAHWKFDEGGGLIAYDSAGDNYGVVYGAQWADGKIDGALEFDGVDDYVALPDNNPVWLPQANFSLCAWVYFDKAPAASGGETFLDLNFADSGNPSNELGYVVSRLAGSGRTAFAMTTTTNTDEDLYSNQVLSENRWYYVVTLRDGTTQAIYIDGRLDNSRTCSPDPIDFVGGYDDDRVNIGRLTTSGGVAQYYVDGKIDDVRIYSRALSGEEIRELYGGPPTADTYHVDGVGGNDFNNGLTEETAFKTIQKGIDVSDGGDTVLVWPGLYQEAANFKGKAIAVKSAAEPAVIEAVGIDAVTFHASEGPDSVLKSFIIKNSRMAVSVKSAGSPTISNLTIVNNDYGIGAYENSEPNISNCILWANKYGDLVGCEAQYSWVQQQLEPNLDDPNGGIVSYWKFDEGSGLIAYDSAGSNDGVVFGSQWVSAQLGGALDFDGVNDYVEVSDSASLDITGQIAVVAWIKRDVTGVRHDIVAKHTGTTPYYGFHLTIGPANNVGLGLTISNSWEQSTAGYIGSGAWHHIAGTYDGTEMRTYIDGELVGSNTVVGSIATNGRNLYIGRTDPTHGGNFVDGMIDDVRIYNRALSASEVLQLYEPVAGIDPLFADVSGGDYHLQSERGRYWPAHDVWVLDRKTSPCIDGGDPAAGPAGEPMPNGGRINMGAYGGTAQASMSEWPIASDVNRDGKVDFKDIAILVAEWLTSLPWAE